MLKDKRLRYTPLTKDEIFEQTKILLQEFHNFRQKYNCPVNAIEIDLYSLQDIIVRIDKRLDYFIIFHEGTDPCEFKKVALLSYWIVKLRPFTIKQKFQNGNDQINEDFCIYLLTKLLVLYDNDILKNESKFQAYLKELKYSLRFRDLTKEALMIAFDSFYFDTI